MNGDVSRLSARRSTSVVAYFDSPEKKKYKKSIMNKKPRQQSHEMKVQVDQNQTEK